MNRSEIVEILGERYPALTRKQVENLVRSIVNSMGEYVANGERMEFRGFGSFLLKQRATNLVRNPRSGITLETDDEHYVIHFRSGKLLKERINAHG